ncbi:hypothetical protein [Caballeronia sp. J97]|uniref:hypothetical protein n=1 Tax=Caballeronia sp. J97 TaxID=2805429 RepID=UPI002AB2E413|nr:hypothetical protein [Caballeronia sp. J97]
MSWQYDPFQSNVATHRETRAQFEVAVREDGRRSYRVEGPIPKGLPSSKLRELENDLHETLLEEDRRSELRALLWEHLGGSNSIAVSAINRLSGRKPISERTVQSWLIERDRVSSRACPGWAITALRDYVAQLTPSEKEALKNEASRRLSMPASMRVLESDALEFATIDIEREASIERKWQGIASPDLARELAKMESYQLGFIHGQNKMLAAMVVSLRKATNFEEFRREFIQLDDEQSSIEGQRRSARREIERGEEEDLSGTNAHF